MRLSSLKNTLFLLVLLAISCGNNRNGVKPAESLSDVKDPDTKLYPVQPGADRPDIYLPILRDKRIALVANQTSRLYSKDVHLADFLLEEQINLVQVFAPEHGFRGTADAGEIVKDGKDAATGLPIISLYGANKKPTAAQLEDLDMVVFDIQDVGARFYTYISTLHYVMEACAENQIPLLVLDRPNPNGHYVDGPILDPNYSSFVGMHPVPVVHGMTIGEYARMINGENWLSGGLKCDLQVIEVSNYKRSEFYSLPVKPSPNLPNDTAINLYPSICFFEGTAISAGRGTDYPFQVYGAPLLPSGNYNHNFVPLPNEGAKYPKFSGENCRGEDLRNHGRLDSLNLEWLINAYRAYPDQDNFFNNFFEKLAGGSDLREQIERGLDARTIRAGWAAGLDNFLKMREAYLIYD